MKARMPVTSNGSRSSEGTRSSIYQVAAHRVLLSGKAGTWRVDVDERALPHGFATQAEAWEAGVREVDRIDRLGSGPGVSALPSS